MHRLDSGLSLAGHRCRCPLLIKCQAQNFLDPLDGEYDLRADIGYGSLTPYTFDITVGAKQEATLHMEATQLLGFDAARHMNVIRHFAYLLAPAKNWAGFGTLNITVVVANNQIFTSNPPLTEQSRDAHTITYTGSFNGIPADALRVATISNQNLWLGSSAIVTIIPNAIVGFLAGLIGFALGVMMTKGSQPRPRSRWQRIYAPD